MYPANKSNAITEDEARKIAGNDAVNDVLKQNCEFTNRIIDECYGVTEMSASVEFEDTAGETRILQCLYLVDSQQLAETDDLGNLDYSNYSFEII